MGHQQKYLNMNGKPLAPSTGTCKENNFTLLCICFSKAWTYSSKYFFYPLTFFNPWSKMLLQNCNRWIETKTKPQFFIQIESIWKVYQAHKRSRLSVNSRQLILALWTALIVFESMVREPSKGMCIISFWNQPTLSYPLPLQALLKHRFYHGHIYTQCFTLFRLFLIRFGII